MTATILVRKWLKLGTGCLCGGFWLAFCLNGELIKDWWHNVRSTSQLQQMTQVFSALRLCKFPIFSGLLVTTNSCNNQQRKPTHIFQRAPRVRAPQSGQTQPPRGFPGKISPHTGLNAKDLPEHSTTRYLHTPDDARNERAGNELYHPPKTTIENVNMTHPIKLNVMASKMASQLPTKVELNMFISPPWDHGSMTVINNATVSTLASIKPSTKSHIPTHIPTPQNIHFFQSRS
ncbi:hypothetical protein LXL04_038589 [Taraxacum kok-saghyz]